MSEGGEVLYVDKFPVEIDYRQRGRFANRTLLGYILLLQILRITSNNLFLVVFFADASLRKCEGTQPTEASFGIPTWRLISSLSDILRSLMPLASPTPRVLVMASSSSRSRLAFCQNINTSCFPLDVGYT